MQGTCNSMVPGARQRPCELGCFAACCCQRSAGTRASGTRGDAGSPCCSLLPSQPDSRASVTVSAELGPAQAGELLSTSVPLSGAATRGVPLAASPPPVYSQGVAALVLSLSHSTPWVAEQLVACLGRVLVLLTAPALLAVSAARRQNLQGRVSCLARCNRRACQSATAAMSA